MLYGLLNIGQSALNASQAWISVTGNNLANADTEGYSRQYVDQRDAGGLTAKPGAQGLGVNAQQIMRFFDSFLERSYVRQATNSARWDEQDTIMTSLENIFNESNRAGLSSSLNKFFTAWQDLALRPEDAATRESLLSYADNLSDMFGSTMDGIKAIQKEMDVSIDQTVDRVNDISKAIADLNRQITSNTVDGVSNPNSLLDKRDQLVRELASLADVETIDNGKGNFRVQLSNGQPLVDGQNSYELKIMGPQAENRLSVNSPYKGSVQFDGADSHEYTVEIVNGGNAGDVPPPQFRVSLDGGKTWLRDDDGKELHYDITDSDGDGTTDQVLVKNLKISFSAADNLHAGDKFDIMPKDGLYWIEPTRGPENITPQIGFDGTDNLSRLTGGKLADKKITISTLWKTVDNQSISEYYANLVTTVGSDRRLSKTNSEYHSALTNDLAERTASVSGVNMDEEMSNLIKFQHSYTAAAKLITTADQMLQTLLGLKQ